MFPVPPTLLYPSFTLSPFYHDQAIQTRIFSLQVAPATRWDACSYKKSTPDFFIVPSFPLRKRKNVSQSHPLNQQWVTTQAETVRCNVLNRKGQEKRKKLQSRSPPAIEAVNSVRSAARRVAGVRRTRRELATAEIRDPIPLLPLLPLLPAKIAVKLLGSSRWPAESPLMSMDRANGLVSVRVRKQKQPSLWSTVT